MKRCLLLGALTAISFLAPPNKMAQAEDVVIPYMLYWSPSRTDNAYVPYNSYYRNLMESSGYGRGEVEFCAFSYVDTRVVDEYVASFQSLNLYYSDIRQDHLTSVSSVGAPSDYRYLSGGGSVIHDPIFLANQNYDAVIVELWWNDIRQDYLLVADPNTRRVAEKTGYRWIDELGWALHHSYCER